MQPLRQEFLIHSGGAGRDAPLPDSSLPLHTVANAMEAAAAAHADLLGVGMDALSAYNLSWAMTRLRILPRRLPKLGEACLLTTWPSALERQNYRRDFTLHTRFGELLAQAVTWWVVFSLESRKTTLLPENLSFVDNDLPYIPDAPAATDGDIRIPPIRQFEQGLSFIVGPNDIDRNNHVNNVRFLDFTLEAARPVRPKTSQLRCMDLVFRAEGRLGDTFVSGTAVSEESPLTILHTLRRGDTELLRGRTVWEMYCAPEGA